MSCKTKDFSSSFIIHSSHVVTGDLFKNPKPDGFIVGSYFKEHGQTPGGSRSIRTGG